MATLTTPCAALLPAATTKAQINPDSRYGWMRNRVRSFTEILWMEAMSDAVGPGDLVLCVNVAPNHAMARVGRCPWWPGRPTVSPRSWDLPAHADVPMLC
jgi:hypothetical protein